MQGRSLARRRSVSARSARISSASTSCGCSMWCSWAARSSGPRSRSSGACSARARTRSPRRPGSASPTSKSRSPGCRATRRSRRPPPCSAASASSTRVTIGRCASSRAASGCACCSPRRSSQSPTCCCSTSRRTTSTSPRSSGSRATCGSSPGAFVVVSHDRHFLNAVCNTIADLDYSELRLYSGDYDAFERAKQLAVAQKDAEIARTEGRIEEMQQFIDRFRAKATKARQASARKKQVEKMELPEIRRSSRRTPGFEFGAGPPLRPHAAARQRPQQALRRADRAA